MRKTRRFASCHFSQWTAAVAAAVIASLTVLPTAVVPARGQEAKQEPNPADVTPPWGTFPKPGAGIELAGEICRMRPETRVIYMTGYAKEFAGSHSQLLTHDVLVKPFTFEQLENVMIQRKRSRH